MKYKVNLFRTRCRHAERIRHFAPWLSVVIIVSIIIFMTFAPASAVAGGQGSPMAMVAMVVGPPILLTILANCIPKVYKLQCHQCKFSKDFILSPKKPKSPTPQAHTDHQA